MNALSETEKSRANEILATGGEWSTIDELVELFDAAEYWSQEFEDNATISAKKNAIRKFAKAWKDEDGFPVIASVETTDIEGNTQRVYKQEYLFDVGDYRQVVAYHDDRSHHHSAMAKSYAVRCKKRFDVQLRLNFDNDDDAPAVPVKKP